jgi:hypothetical protein
MFFDLPGVLETFLKDGPLRQVLDSATALVRDEARCSIHVVTVPEPLAVNETIQLYKGLRARRDLHLGYLIINRIPRAWLDEAEQRLVRAELEDASSGQSWADDLAVAEYLLRRRETAEKCMRGLCRDIDLPTIRLDAQEDESPGIIEALSNALEQPEAW